MSLSQIFVMWVVVSLVVLCALMTVKATIRWLVSRSGEPADEPIQWILEGAVLIGPEVRSGNKIYQQGVVPLPLVGMRVIGVAIPILDGTMLATVPDSMVIGSDLWAEITTHTDHVSATIRTADRTYSLDHLIASRTRPRMSLLPVLGTTDQ